MRSLFAILTITQLTLSEARRRRIVTASLLCGAAFLAVFSTGLFFIWREEMSTSRAPFIQRQATLVFFTLAGLYAANFLSVLFAVLLPVDTLSGEIDSGVMQTLASKPIRRGEILLGKWLGHAVIVSGYLVLLSGGVLLVVRTILGYLPVRLGWGMPVILLEVLLLLTVSVAGGTRLSTVTNGVMALGFYGIAFIGGWIEQIGAIGGIQAARMVGVVASLISPSDALWRLAAYDMQPQIVRDFGALLFTAASVPTPLMVWWGLGFTLLTLAWAVRSFARRPL